MSQLHFSPRIFRNPFPNPLANAGLLRRMLILCLPIPLIALALLFTYSHHDVESTLDRAIARNSGIAAQAMGFAFSQILQETRNQIAALSAGSSNLVEFQRRLLRRLQALNQLGERSTLNTALYSLSHLLRYVLSKERYTTLGQECAFLEDYLTLQKLRFADRLTYELICPEELQSARIPRLLLQPLLENAIIHGIEPSESPCLCRLVCEKKQDRLVLSILDNGVGFRQEEFDRKLQEAIAITADPTSAAFRSSTREKTSIGIYYVRERLKMWSERAVLQVRREDKTTIAEITVPLEEVSYETSDR